MDISYRGLIDEALKRREKQHLPLAFAPCTGLFSRDDIFSKVFQMCNGNGNDDDGAAEANDEPTS
jgi:hypothetical protein